MPVCDTYHGPQNPQIPVWILSGVKFDLFRIVTSCSLMLRDQEKPAESICQKVA